MPIKPMGPQKAVMLPAIRLVLQMMISAGAACVQTHAAGVVLTQQQRVQHLGGQNADDQPGDDDPGQHRQLDAGNAAQRPEGPQQIILHLLPGC